MGGSGPPRCPSELAANWRQLAAPCVALCTVVAISFQVPPIMLPALMREFHATEFGVSWLGAAFQLSKGLFTIPGGYLVDRLGASRCIKGGAIVTLAASAYYAFARSLWELIILHAIFGLTYNLNGLGPFIVFTASWFDRNRACAIGILVSAFSMAGVVFAPIAAIIIDHGGWRRASEFCTLAYAVLGLPLIFGVLCDGPLQKVRTPSPGAQDIERKEAQHCPRPVSSFEISSRDAAMRRARLEIIPQCLRERFGEGAFWHLAAMSFCNVYIIIALLNTLVLYLSNDAGIPLPLCSRYASIVNLASVFGKLGTGALLDGRHRRRASLGSYALLVVGTCLSLDVRGGRLRPATGRTQLLGFSVVYGFAFGASYTVIASRPAQIFGSMEGFGKVQAVLTLCQTLGGVAGTLVTGKLREATGSFAAPFCTFVAMAALCLLHCALLDRASPCCAGGRQGPGGCRQGP